MNSTAIRRLNRASSPNETLPLWLLQPMQGPPKFLKSKTSIVGVDTKGYLAYQKLRQKRVGGPQEVDRLIDLARRNELAARIYPAPYAG